MVGWGRIVSPLDTGARAGPTPIMSDSNTLTIKAIKGRSVIVADDDDMTRALLRSLLRRVGMEVVEEARDGARAIAAFEKHQPQIVCLDAEMPDMSGFDVLRKIREQNRDVIVLIFSASPTADNVRAAMEAGADGFIAKPFSADRIARAIERAQKNRGTGAALQI